MADPNFRDRERKTKERKLVSVFLQKLQQRLSRIFRRNKPTTRYSIPRPQDFNGSVPVWEAIRRRRESVYRLLLKHGPNLRDGDVGQVACIAVEQNSLGMLKDIIRYGGDVTLPSTKTGTTALHVAVCQDNVEIVRFLLGRGADTRKQDKQGRTPKDLACMQGRVEIEAIIESTRKLIESTRKLKAQHLLRIPEKKSEIRCLGRATMPLSRERSLARRDWSRSQSHPRLSSNNFHNSPFGMMSTAQNNFCVNMSYNVRDGVKIRVYPIRVIISCPEKSNVVGIVVLLPRSFEELLELGYKKFGVCPAKILSKDGYRIEDISAIRDKDHLVFVSVDPTRVTISCPEVGNVVGKVVFLPRSFKELLELGAEKFGICHAKVVLQNGGEIENIRLIKDNDHLVFVTADLESNIPERQSDVKVPWEF